MTTLDIQSDRVEQARAELASAREMLELLAKVARDRHIRTDHPILISGADWNLCDWRTTGHE